MPVALWLFWCLCLTATDIANGAAWANKWWGINPAGGSTGLAESWLVLVVLIAVVSLASRVAWEAVWDVWRAIVAVICAMAVGHVAPYGGRADWPFNDADQLGVFAAVGIFVALLGRNWVVAIIAAGALLLSHTRAGALGLVAGIIAGRYWRLLFLALPLAGAIILLHGFGTGSEADRLSLARQGLAAVLARPWGWGHAGWIWIRTAATTQSYAITSADRVHFLPLDWAILGGVPGMLALTSLLFWTAWQLRGAPNTLAVIAAYSAAMLFLWPTWIMDLVLVLLCGYAGSGASDPRRV